ncbi:hypothetical protein AVEN_27380-1 [Araneus ventricosus]|uniref:DDE-1 domain-containing protein n=1 Tax=Araneus ventricosus TaxID=182803 RepID=A0A4Y2JSZ0_ARAVE|nr:hypothetical protein AVEN_27380-1 [Araneus ventricosus]
MEQGAVATFKVFYSRTTFSQVVAETVNDAVTLCDVWKSYRILDCIKKINSTWDEDTDTKHIELVDYADGELTNEDIIDVEALQHLEEEEGQRTEEVQKKFTVHGLAGVFSKINAAMLERIWIQILNVSIKLNEG